MTKLMRDIEAPAARLAGTLDYTLGAGRAALAEAAALVRRAEHL